MPSCLKPASSAFVRSGNRRLDRLDSGRRLCGDAPFDSTWAQAWGEKNDVQVTIDHIYKTRLPALAVAEVKAQQGHDIFGFPAPPAAYEDQVIDHAAIIREVERAVGPYGRSGREAQGTWLSSRSGDVSQKHVVLNRMWLIGIGSPARKRRHHCYDPF